jgi:hypothetical protein
MLNLKTEDIDFVRRCVETYFANLTGTSDRIGQNLVVTQHHARKVCPSHSSKDVGWEANFQGHGGLETVRIERSRLA